jgi:ssDNA-binding Zn-finger/Zn-ribbon topoisomerase 1
MSNFKCEKCGTVCYDTPNGYITGCEHYPEDAVDKIIKSLDLTVTERINTQPEFRTEILRQVIECISSDNLLVAKKMLDQVVEADVGYKGISVSHKELMNERD